MQTFLPYPDFKQTAKTLDYRRLGKQRVEAYQILKALTGQTKGWINHPATQMWKGYENALILYMNTMIDEWESRGYKNNMQRIVIDGDIILPSWLGNQEFHSSHRSNLLRKDTNYYGQFNWTEPLDLPYIWPTK